MGVARSRRSHEECVFTNNYSDLQQAIVHPVVFATRLVQERVVDAVLVTEVRTSSLGDLQKNAAILDAVRASIHSDPSRFEILMSVLEASPESAPLAGRMREELSELYR